MKVVAVASAAALALALVPRAAADYALVVRQDQTRPGEMVTVWGGGCFGSPALGMPMYLVPARLMRFDAVRVRHRPDGGFYHYLGRVTCTHVNEPEWLPNGWWSAGTFRFRTPRVARGWFKVAMYCPPCRSVMAATTYFDGRRTHYIGRGLRVLAAK